MRPPGIKVAAKCALPPGTLSQGESICRSAASAPREFIRRASGQACTTNDVTSCEQTPTLAPEDPDKLPKCACAKGGKARCIAKNKLASRLAAKLDGCTDVAPRSASMARRHRGRRARR